MKTKNLFYCLALSMGLASCIQNEEPNAEADIETCTVVENIDNPNGSILIREPIIENSRITLLTRVDADLSQVKLEFTLTQGATISPESGTARDLSSPQTYEVTSEDGKWKKTYTVSCNTNEMQDRFDFEYSVLNENKKYYVFFEMNEKKDTLNIWGNGNGAISLIFGSKSPEEYPTTPFGEGRPDSDGIPSKCAKLHTVAVGTLGNLAKKPIAAGNLFIGEFIDKDAMTKPLEAPHFGRPFTNEPKRMTGYYKYKAGDTLIDKDRKVIPNQRDSMDIYAVFYEIDENVQYLNGTVSDLNSLTSPNIVSLARIAPKDKKEVEEFTDDWIYFNIPFEPKNGRVVDPNKLINSQYGLSLVFTSSINGANFIGAIGSTLLVDEISLISADNTTENEE